MFVSFYSENKQLAKICSTLCAGQRVVSDAACQHVRLNGFLKFAQLESGVLLFVQATGIRFHVHTHVCGGILTVSAVLNAAGKCTFFFPP